MTAHHAPPDPAPAGWPALRIDEWAATRDTLQLWTQVVGKIRLANAPMVNHWWQVPFYVSARGLTTSTIPHGNDVFDIEFDFHDHLLRVRAGRGDDRLVDLTPKPVSRFYGEVMGALRDLGLDTTVLARPVEVETVIPFEQDHQQRTYDPDHARRFWGQLVQASRVMERFRARFGGKVSPVHVFWGGLDLACTRFSGRTAPPHPGGYPNVGDWVMVESYSHEVSSCGFWPGGGDEGAFYSYAYPEPPGFADAAVRPAAAGYSPAARQFLLPYEAVRTADNPDAALLAFFQSTYEAAADLAGWDRAALEVDPDRWAGAGRAG